MRKLWADKSKRAVLADWRKAIRRLYRAASSWAVLVACLEA